MNNQPTLAAQVNDTITVAVDVTVNEDMYYVNVEEPIPAGTELVDKSLQVTSQLQQTIPDNGWGVFSNAELHTEKLVLSASFLRRGTYRFTYQLRATTPGTYRVIPTNGQEFYFPEVFGHGPGSLFTVKP